MFDETKVHIKRNGKRKSRGVQIQVLGQRRENMVPGSDEVMMTYGEKVLINRIN